MRGLPAGARMSRRSAAPVKQQGGALGMVFVPIAHDLVHAATVHAAGQAAHLLYRLKKERRAWRKFLVVDIAVRDWFIPKTSFAMLHHLHPGFFRIA
jgi:hypothetical protein